VPVVKWKLNVIRWARNHHQEGVSMPTAADEPSQDVFPCGEVTSGVGAEVEA
jgi:hypothetical protein